MGVASKIAGSNSDLAPGSNQTAAMVDMMTSRGSFLFFIPWEGYTLVGTTDVKTGPDLHHEVPEDEIQFFINECEMNEPWP